MIEYCQGAVPLTLWESGPRLFMNDVIFKRSIIAIPAFGNSYDLDHLKNQKPVVVVSSYEKVSYIAVYAQALDSEARGFVRTFVLVVSNRSSRIIKNIHFLKLEQVLSLIEDIQKAPREKFLKEIVEYGLELKATIDTVDDQMKDILQSKMVELSGVLKLFSLELPTDQIRQPKTFEHFTRINNNLREFTYLLDWIKVEKLLMDFSEKLNQLPYGANLAAFGSFVEEGPSFDFANAKNRFPVFISGVFFWIKSLENEKDPNNNNLLVKSLVEKQIFHHCIYSLLSGHTLLIISKERFSDAISLGEHLQVFVPFFNKKFSIATDGEIDSNDCEQYSIAVTSGIVDELNPNISVLNFDNNTYCGIGCPKNSFVNNKLGIGADQSEGIFLLIQFNILKHAANSFINKLAEFSKESRNQEEIINSLSDIGFTSVDKPIIDYWKHCYYNQQEIRPFTFNNKMKCEIVSISFSV